MLLVGPRWESRKGVQFLSNAAHSMTQFTEDGSNMAIFDAVELADMTVCGGRLGE